MKSYSDKLNPRLLAIGLGATAGYNFLDYDDSVVTEAMGMMIGAALGSAVKLDVDKKAMETYANNKINNLHFGIDHDALNTKNRSSTYNDRIAKIISEAERLANNNSSLSNADYDLNNLSKTLSPYNIDKFKAHLTGLNSDESVRIIETAVMNKSGNLFTNISNIDDKYKSVNTVTRIKSDASSSAKLSALSSFLRSQGIDGQEHTDKMRRLNYLITRSGSLGDIEFSEGSIKIGDISLPVSKNFTSLDSNGKPINMLGRVFGGNFYNVRQVNLMGSAIVQTHTLADIEAKIARPKFDASDFLDKFNVSDQLFGRGGLAPEEAVSMLYELSDGKLSSAQLKEISEQLKSNVSFNQDLSAQLQINKSLGITASQGYGLEVSRHGQAVSERLDYSFTLNTNSVDQPTFFNESYMMRPLGITSPNLGVKSENKQLTERLQLINPMYGAFNSNADKTTQIANFDGETNRAWSMFMPLERNSMVVYNREQVTHTSNSLNNLTKAIIDATGGSHIFASSIPLNTYGIDTSSAAALIDSAGNVSSLDINDFMARMYGSAYAVGDGTGLIRKSSADKLKLVGGSSVVLHADKDQNFAFVNKGLQTILEKGLDLDDAENMALKAAIRKGQRHVDSLQEIKGFVQELEGFHNNRPAHEQDMFDLLKRVNPFYNQYNTVADMFGSQMPSNPTDVADELYKRVSYAINNKIKQSKLDVNYKHIGRLHGDAVGKEAENYQELVRNLRNGLKTIITHGNYADMYKHMDDINARLLESVDNSEMYRAVFPKPGSVIGVDNDGTRLTVPNGHNSVKLSAINVDISSVDNQQQVTGVRITYEGEHKIGEEIVTKAHGASAKEQLVISNDKPFDLSVLLHRLKDTKKSFAFVEDALNPGELGFRFVANSGNVIQFTSNEVKNLDFMKVLRDIHAYHLSTGDKVEASLALADIQEFKGYLNEVKVIDTMSETGSAGTKAHTKLKASMNTLLDNYDTKVGQFKAGDDLLNNIESNAVRNHVLSVLKSTAESGITSTARDDIVQGLADMVISMSSDRSSQDYLLSSHTSFLQNAENRLKSLESNIATHLKTNKHGKPELSATGLKDFLMNEIGVAQSNQLIVDLDDIINRTANGTLAGADLTYIKENLNKTIIDTKIVPMMDQLNSKNRSTRDFTQILHNIMQADKTNYEINGIYDPSSLDNTTKYVANAHLTAVSDYFIQAAKLRPEEYKSSILKQASFSLAIDYTSGSGKEGKSISWNAQKILLQNDWTQEELNMLGKFSVADITDLEALISIREHNIEGINSRINSQNLLEVRQALAASPERRRDALRTALNLGTNQILDSDNMVVYNLSENKHGFKNIPITFENSNMFGGYTSNDGLIHEKRLSEVTREIIDADLALKATNITQSEKDLRQKRFDALIEEYAGHIRTTLGGADNIMKKAFTREGFNASYRDVRAIRGIVSKLAETESVIGVDSYDLIRQFKNVGVIGDNNTYNGKTFKGNIKGLLAELEAVGHLKKIEKDGFTGYRAYQFLEEVDAHGNVKAAIPLFTTIAREPTQGPASARIVEMIYDKSLDKENGQGKFSYIAYNDFLYAKGQFGDFDLDHIFHYNIKNKNMTREQAQQLYEKGKRVTQTMFDSKDFISVLGVKGSNKEMVSSVMHAVEGTIMEDLNSNTTRSYNDYMDSVNEFYRLKKQQAGDRKVVSPIATRLAVDLNESLEGVIDPNMDYTVKMRARVLMHYAVENLIKSQHISLDVYKNNATTQAEDMFNLIFSGSADKNHNLFKDTFIDSVRQVTENNMRSKAFIESMEAKVKSKYAGAPLPAPAQFQAEVNQEIDLIRAQIREASELAVKGIFNLADKNNTAVSPMHLKKPRTIADVAGAIDKLAKAAIAEDVNLPVLPVEQSVGKEFKDLSLVDQAKYEYNKGKYSISEVVKNNKMLLGAAAGIAVGGAMMFQSGPDFKNNSPLAKPENMLGRHNALLDGSKSVYDDTAALENYNTQKPSAFFNKLRNNNQSFTSIDATRIASENITDPETLHNNIDQFVFGGGLSSARVVNFMDGY